MDKSKFPHAIDCYLLVSRNGWPPYPEDDPTATAIVYSEEEVDSVKKQLLDEHPGGWLVERPLDVR